MVKAQNKLLWEQGSRSAYTSSTSHPQPGCISD